MHEDDYNTEDDAAEQTSCAHDELAVLHWFCFSFTGPALTGLGQCYASSYVGYKYQYVTLQMVNNQKKESGVTQDSVLLGCIYLGHMTKEQFTTEVEEA